MDLRIGKNRATRLKKLLVEIEKLDERGEKLAGRLCGLIREYDMRGVRALVEQIQSG